LDDDQPQYAASNSGDGSGSHAVAGISNMALNPAKLGVMLRL
jgi:hypothetical protein